MLNAQVDLMDKICQCSHIDDCWAEITITNCFFLVWKPGNLYMENMTMKITVNVHPGKCRQIIMSGHSLDT